MHSSWKRDTHREPHFPPVTPGLYAIIYTHSPFARDGRGSASEKASTYSQQPLSLLTIRELAVADVLQVRAASAGIRVSRVCLGDLPVSTTPPL